jgi:hypothetical protein
MTPSRWFGVGSADSAPEAVGQALVDALIHDDPKLLIVFCSEALDVGAVVREIWSRSEGTPMIGCTTAGEIATSGPGDASLVVAALGGDGFWVETAVGTEASKDLRAAGASAARCFASPPEDRPHRALMLLSDGLAGDQQEVVRGAYSVLGAGVPLVGGCAGDDLKMTRTFQLYDDRVMSDSVVAAGIASSGPLGVGVRHGWRRVGEPMLVTRSGGNQVYSLDDRPALDVYLERLSVSDPASLDEQQLTRVALTHPLGLSRPTGDEVRFIRGADLLNRSLSSIAEVPQGALVWMMEGDSESVLTATDGACSEALMPLEGAPPLGVVAFDCVARRGVLGDNGIQTEIDRLARLAGAPVAGFYTYGEIARTRGVSGFHNQTLVVLSIG